jgi:hypothetical protein
MNIFISFRIQSLASVYKGKTFFTSILILPIYSKICKVKFYKP